MANKKGARVYVEGDRWERFKQEFNASEEINEFMKQRLGDQGDQLEIREEELQSQIDEQKEVVDSEKDKLERLKAEHRTVVNTIEAREEAEGDDEKKLEKAISILERKRNEAQGSPADWHDDDAVRYWAQELEMSEKALIEKVEDEVRQ